MNTPSKDAPGHYWVRFEYRPKYLPEWSVSYWDGERWTNIGHEDSFTPEQASIVDWRGPLTQPEPQEKGEP